MTQPTISDPIPTSAKQLNILCVCEFLFGRPFIMEAVKLGHKVWVLTSKSGLEGEWPRDVIQDVWGIPGISDEANFDTARKAVSYAHRNIGFDRIVGFSDWTLDVAAGLREHLRIGGMGETTTYYFRDKLAMRMKAHEDGIPMPEFVPLFTWPKIHEYLDRVPPPWVIKPRMKAGSSGIKKIASKDDLWPILDKQGDLMSFHLLEKYTPGSVYHVDSIVSEREVVFASSSRYGTPMLDITKGGGVFTTSLLQRGSADEVALQELNKRVIKSLGLVRGVSHIEYIKGDADGKFYFLEAAARIGSARIPDVVFHARGICLWHEWAKIECLDDYKRYRVPEPRDDYAGVISTLSKTEFPDLSGFTDEEIVYRQSRKHIGLLIVRSKTPERVNELLEGYAARFRGEMMAHKADEE